MSASRATVAVLLALASLVVPGCGGDEPPASSSDSATSSPTTEGSDGDLAAGTLEQLTAQAQDDPGSIDAVSVDIVAGKAIVGGQGGAYELEFSPDEEKELIATLTENAIPFSTITGKAPDGE